MIVPSYISSAPSALQGVDFLNRGSKTSQVESADSSFSEILGSSGASDPVSKLSNGGGGPRVREGSPGSGGRNESSQASQAEGAARSFGSGGIAGNRADDAEASEPNAFFGSLEDSPVLLRDPRLEDPAELALEAAAIAAASAFLTKPFEGVPVPNVVDEPQLEGGGEQGGANGSFLETPPASFSAPTPALLAVLGNQSTADQLPSASLPDKSAAAAADEKSQNLQSGVRSESVGTLPTVDALQSVSGVPRVVASVVVKATPSQVRELASNGGVEGILSSVQSGVALVTGASASPQAGFAVAQSPADNQPAVANVSGEPRITDSGLNDEPNPAGFQVDSDEAFLASDAPENPAAAFFAERLNVRGGAVEKGAELPPDASSDEAVPVDSQATAPVLTSGPRNGESSDSAMGDSRGGTADEGLHHGKPRVSSGRLQGEPSGDLPSSGEGDLKLGTFGAEAGGVYQQSLEASAFENDQSIGVADSTDGSNSVLVSNGGVAKPSLSQAATVDGASREILSRPTVLPSVNTRFSEVSGVIQRVLERARSENPSHLAVEINLEDGSSFGLEVRMSSAGLQASFRSDSQQLLKALENNWAGFLSKEPADQKAIAAAFESRAGFGEFSNNGSGANERREHLEDSASSALLGGLDRSDARFEKSQGEARSGARDSQQGMALYA